MGTVKIPIGPQHPALKEPESFLISLDGERITDFGMRLGYNHRGIEKAAESRTFIESMYLIERVCGICSHSHSTAFIQAVEDAANTEIPKRAKYIRSIIGELERVHSHLLWLGVAAHEVGFDTLLMYTWRDREVVMDLLAAISGNRVNYGMNTYGGVRRDLSKEQLLDISKAVDILEERTKYFAKVSTEEITFVKRLSGVGYISKEDVLRLGTVGPTGRASGMSRDTRKDDPYAAYDEVDFNVITDNHCDVYGRAVVRIFELMETYKILRQLVKNIPDGDIAVKFPRRVPAGEATSRYEAPRGEDVHYVKTNGTDKPERVKLRAPTLANLQSVATMLKGNNLADVPIAIAAIDPCFSCTDRTIKVNNFATGETKTVDWRTLRAQSIEWYKKERGIDFTELNKKYRKGE
ncbi:MAG: nickel-dependent hydrogenase large subunit [Pseudomonadota bacterium]